MSREQEERSLSTADLVAGAQTPMQRSAERAVDPSIDNVRDVREVREVRSADARSQDGQAQMQSGQSQVQREQLAALFAPDMASDFQSRWDAVQIGFVDDPVEAVRKADELVAQVMKSLAESFANERERIEGGMDQSSSQSTENMRLALRRYRSFFQRLLSL